MQPQEINIAHSPDPDDAFMFYALANDKLDTGGLKFTHTLCDIETLNRKALEGEYEVTALSFHAYAYLTAKYALLSCGASIGDKYGPLIVASRPIHTDELAEITIAVPGTMTTAFLVLKLLCPQVRYTVIPFDKIPEEVAKGTAGAGLIIHEGQLTYSAGGLHKVLDLGQWWYEQTQLPLPLGGNGIRRDLDRELALKVSDLIKQSIRYALAHRSEALAYALQFARGMSTDLADKFVGMYVNSFTLDYGPRGRQALERLYATAYDRGIIPHTVSLDFV